MIKSLVAAAGLSLGLMSTGAFAQNADFDLTNSTGYPIRELYVSPSKAKTWGGDVLCKHVINNGDMWHITFPRGASSCMQDIKIVFDDDSSEVVWEDFDLCKINKITLTYSRSSGETKATVE